MRPILFSVVASLSFAVSGWAAENWARHTVDDSFRGADGVRLADFNGDGWLDIVTGWEESGIIRMYLNPGPERVRDAWPAVTVGKSPSPEDAVPVDVNRDGMIDIVSCHEGKTRRVLVHFNRAGLTSSEALLRESNWQTVPVDQLNGQLWMFATPLKLGNGQSDVGERHAVVLGSKGQNASITLLISPDDQAVSKDLSKWHAVRLRDAGWIMSLRLADMDSDGDEDVVYSDRKGELRGVGWLEQPDDPATNQWGDHILGGSQVEPMFIDLVPATEPRATPTILVSTRNSIWIKLNRLGSKWQSTNEPNPESVPNGKAIARLSPNQLVMTANTVAGNVPKRPGVWVRQDAEPWQAIGAEHGGKYDRIEVLDLNGDGRPDVLTCEERQNLGVVWYENPGP